MGFKSIKERQALNIVMLEVSGWGGLCHYTYNLCQELSEAGENIVQISNINNELANCPNKFTLLRIIDTNYNYLKKWWLILKYLVIHKVDIFHIQTLITARKDFAIFLFMKILPFRVFYTAHNVLPHDKHERDAFGMKYAFWCIYHLSDFIITHSEKDKEEIMSKFHVSAKKIATIPHGNYDFLRTTHKGEKESIRRKFDIGEEKRVILFFGAIRRYKGVHVLIDAFASVVGEDKAIKLLIVGHDMDSNYYDELQHLIKRHRLHDSVVLYEEYVPSDEIIYYFEAADIVALPYKHIYDSGVLRLAFSFDKPVIATRVGIFNELIEDGKNGFLADNNLDSLVNAIKRFQDTSLHDLRIMGQRSRLIYAQDLNWRDIANKTLRTYHCSIKTQSNRY